MTQLETIRRALQVFGTPDETSPVALAMVKVLKATEDVKDWEDTVGDVSECECDQCLATVALAEAMIEEMENASDG